MIRCVIAPLEYDACLHDPLSVAWRRTLRHFHYSKQPKQRNGSTRCKLIIPCLQYASSARTRTGNLCSSPRRCMKTDMFGLGCARGTLLMWQRTYPQCPHPEGSKFESIRTNRSSTKLHPWDYKAYALCRASKRQDLHTKHVITGKNFVKCPQHKCCSMFTGK